MFGAPHDTPFSWPFALVAILLAGSFASIAAWCAWRIFGVVFSGGPLLAGRLLLPLLGRWSPPFALRLPWRVPYEDQRFLRREGTRLKSDYEAAGLGMCWDLRRGTPVPPLGDEFDVSTEPAAPYDLRYRSADFSGILFFGRAELVRPIRAGIESRRGRRLICPACREIRLHRGALRPRDLSCPCCGHAPLSAHEILEGLSRGKFSSDASFDADGL